MAAHFLSALVADPRPDRALRVDGRSEPLATSVEGAFDSAARNRGLLGRSGLPAGAALVIAPTSSVHTFFMKFAIDLVYAARDGRVVKVRHHVRPWRLSMAPGAFAVVELAAGAAERCGVQPGDVLRLD